MNCETSPRGFVVSVIVKNVLIVSAILCVVTETFENVSFLRTRALHASLTTLTLSENVNTPLSFFGRISPSDPLKLILHLNESVTDHLDENKIFPLPDGSFPSSSFSFLKEAVPNLTDRGPQFLDVFLFLSNIALLSVNVNVNVNVNENENANDSRPSSFVLLYVSNPVLNVICYGQKKIAIELHLVRSSFP